MAHQIESKMNENLKKLETPLYLLALILVASPALELAGTGWPIQLRNPEWRFGVFGLLSQAFITPIIGSTIVLLVAELLERRHVKLFITLVNAIVALVVLVALPLFALDALELRGRITAQTPEQLDAVVAAKRSLDIAVGKAILIHSLVFLFLLLLVRVGFKSWRQQTAEEKRRAAEPHPLSLARLGVADETRAQRQAPMTDSPPPPPEPQLEPIDDGEEPVMADSDMDSETAEDGELPKLDLD